MSDEIISDLVAFSEEMQKHLTALGQDFEAKRTVVEGLDVKVIVKTIDNTQYLEISSLLNPSGILRTLDVTSWNNSLSQLKDFRITGLVCLRKL